MSSPLNLPLSTFEDPVIRSAFRKVQQRINGLQSQTSGVLDTSPLLSSPPTIPTSVISGSFNDDVNPAAISTTAAATGTDTYSARRDHVHKLDITATAFDRFLRSDVDDTGTGILTLSNATPLKLTAANPIIEVGSGTLSTAKFRSMGTISQAFQFEDSGATRTLKITLAAATTTLAGNTGLTFTAGGLISFTAGGSGSMSFSAPAGQTITLNNNATDTDTIVKGSTDANLVYVDAGTNRVGIGTNVPDHLLTVDGDIGQDDNQKHVFGTGNDAEIYYGGTNLVINPAVAGVGGISILGGGNFLLARGNAGGFTTRSGSAKSTLGIHHGFYDSNGTAFLTISAAGVGGAKTELDYIGTLHIKPSSGQLSLGSSGQVVAALGDLRIDEDLDHDGTLAGFFNTTPVTQPSDPGALTDSTGGTANSTLVAISGSGDDVNINDNFADLAAKYAAVRDRLRNLGLFA